MPLHSNPTSAALTPWGPQAPSDQPFPAISTWGMDFNSWNGCWFVQETQWWCTLLSKVSNEQFHHKQKQQTPMDLLSSWMRSSPWPILYLVSHLVRAMYWHIWSENLTQFNSSCCCAHPATPLTQELRQVMYSCHYAGSTQLDSVSTRNV